MKVSLTKAKPKKEDNESQATSVEKQKESNKITKANEVVPLDPFLWQPFKQEEEGEKEKKINYVNARFKDITADGLAEILFNTDMHDQTSGFHLNMIN